MPWIIDLFAFILPKFEGKTFGSYADLNRGRAGEFEKVVSACRADPPIV
jgi:hypothetical protein